MTKSITMRCAAALAAMLCLLMLVTNVGGSHISSAVKAYAAEEDTAALALFLNAGYDKENCSVYDGTSKEKFFKMNGRTYYQGLTLGSYYNSAITFNVAPYSTFTFTLGHWDNKGGNELGAIDINLDGAWAQTIDVSREMTCTEYTIDVSAASTIQLMVPADNYYCFGDISVDGIVTENTCDIPDYTTSELFVQSAYDTENFDAYNGTTASEYFNMAGRSYYQGVIFGSYYDSAATFNVENVDSITFTVGHRDNKGGDETGAIDLYLDGAWSQSIDVSLHMLCTEYTIDVSAASTLRILVPSDNYYGFGDITVDGIAVQNPHVVPEYADSESFVMSYYNTENFDAYDGTAGTNYFNMAGRSYYQGVVLGSYYDSAATFNVENVDSLTFTVGHRDNKGGDETGTIDLYLDGKWSQSIDVSLHMLCTEYTIDVSGASTFRIYVPADNYYGFGDITVDGIAVQNPHVVPEYVTSESFVKSYYDPENFVAYDGSTGNSYFNMAGRSYYQGVVFGSYYDSAATFNVENVDSITFTVGHRDNKGGDEVGTIELYMDGKWVQNIDVSREMLCTEYTIDVSAASTLRVYVPADNYYGLGDISVDGIAVSKVHAVPDYTTSESFVTSFYDTANFDAYDGTTGTNYFNMAGRSYYQGLIFGSYYDSAASFNVENLESVTFSIGHRDNKGGNAEGTIEIYLDGKWAQSIDVNAKMLCTEYTIDVSAASTMKIYVPADNYYGFGDIAVDEITCARPHGTPTYDSGAEFVVSGYDAANSSVYDGTSGNNTFTMMGTSFMQGVTFGTYYESYRSFNVENVETLTFTLGRLADKDAETGTLVIELDGVIYRQIEVNPGMLNTAYTMNVSEASTVRFYFDDYMYYGIANIMLNGDASEFKGTAYTDPDAIIDLDAVPEFSLGDVNLDGVVDATDASYVLIAAAAIGSGNESGLTEEQETNADVNLDGAFDATDAAFVLQYAAAAGTGYTGTPEEFFSQFQ